MMRARIITILIVICLVSVTFLQLQPVGSESEEIKNDTVSNDTSIEDSVERIRSLGERKFVQLDQTRYPEYSDLPPNQFEFMDPPGPYRVLPIYTGEVTEATIDKYVELGVGGLVINSWDWTPELMNYASTKDLILWANDYYMYPSGNANPFGGVHSTIWNPDFEANDFGLWPEGWVWTYYDWPVVDDDGSDSHSGVKAVACDDMNSFFWPIGVKEGSTINLSWWSKGEPGVTEGRIVVMWQNSTDLLSFDYSLFEVTNLYKKYSAEFTVPPGTNVARIVLQSQVTGDLVWFDDVYIRNATYPMVNLNGNPSLEADLEPNGVPDGWAFGEPTNPPVYDTSGTESRTGTDAIKVNNTQTLLQFHTCSTGDEYFFSQWIKGDSGNEIGQSAILWLDSSFQIIDIDIDLFQLGTAYEFHYLQATAPIGTSYVVVVLSSAQDSDFVWVDDVMINETLPVNDGVSRGPVLDGHPELEAQGLYYNSEDVTFPSTSALTIPYGKMISAVAAPVGAGGTLDLSSAVDVSSSRVGDSIQWAPASGTWRVMCFVVDILFNGTECDPAITNMHQINVMNPTAVQSFIDSMYDGVIRTPNQQYMGSMIKASFTDEVSNMAGYFLNNMPYPVVAWLDDPVNDHQITDEFQAMHGYDLMPKLPALFNDVGPETSKYRCSFYNTTGKLQGDAYYKMIGDWCSQQGINFSGHLLSEESIIHHTAFYGDFFESIKHMGYPGMDTLLHSAGELDKDAIVPKLVHSTQILYDKPHSMTEYSVHSGSFDIHNMTSVINWEAVQGIDIVTSFSYWVGYLSDADNKQHAEHVGRTNYMLDKGEYSTDIAVLYPIQTAQAQYVPSKDIIWDREKFGGYEHDESFTDLTLELLGSQLDFIYINDENIERAEINTSSGDTVLFHPPSGQEFKVIVVPEMNCITMSTFQKIKDFLDAGGKVVAVGDLPYQTSHVGNDSAVVSMYQEMFNLTGVGPRGYSLKSNVNGGAALWADGGMDGVSNAIEDYEHQDLYITDTDDDKIYYMKREHEDYTIYYLVNNYWNDATHDYWFKAQGTPKLWDPWDGSIIQPTYTNSWTVGGNIYTKINDLTIPAYRSVFVVIDKPKVNTTPGDISIEPGLPTIGDTVDITLNVSNDGKGLASSLTVKLFKDSKSPIDQIDGTAAFDLLPGQATDVSFEWDSTDGSGNNTFYWVISEYNTPIIELKFQVFVNTPPIPLYETQKDTVYTYEVLEFSAANSSDEDGILTNYTWDFSDGTKKYGVEVSHFWVEDGKYYVNLTVIDTSGINRTFSRIFTVLNQCPVVNITAQETVGTINTVFKLDGTGSFDPDGTIVNYTWGMSDGSVLFGPVIEYRYKKSGFFGVALDVRDDDGNKTRGKILLEVKNLLPEADFSVSPFEGNISTTFTFTPIYSDQDGFVEEVLWSFSDGVTSPESVFSRTFPDDKEYEVTLRVKDEDDDWSLPVTKVIEVLNLPPSADLKSNAMAAFVGEQINFSAEGSSDPDDPLDALEFFWDMGDKTPPMNGMNLTYVYSEVGNYTITLTVTDDDNTTSTDTILINVLPKPVTPPPPPPPDDDVDDDIQPNATDDDDDLGAQVGVGVFIVVLVLVIVLLIFFVIQRRKKNAYDEAESEKDLYDDSTVIEQGDAALFDHDKKKGSTLKDAEKALGVEDGGVEVISPDDAEFMGADHTPEEISGDPPGTSEVEMDMGPLDDEDGVDIHLPDDDVVGEEDDEFAEMDELMGPQEGPKPGDMFYDDSEFD